MKKILLLGLTVMFASLASSAQYFCTEKGKVLFYKETSTVDKETQEAIMKSTVLDVVTEADGVIKATEEDVKADPNNPLSEIKTKHSYIYTPQTDITKVILMSGDDFKEFVMTMIRDASAASGRYLSDSEFADLEKVLSTKGSIEFDINPADAAGTKIPNASLRLSGGQMTMTMNLWEAKFLGTESITVEAGTYDCVKVSYVLRISTPNGSQKQNFTEWYAKGIGVVKSIETDKKGNILNEQALRLIK